MRSSWTLALMAGLVVAGPASAQVLRGTILDSQSGEPVMLAYVGLLAEDRDLVVAALADNSGGFELQAPRPGSYFVYVNRTGYETVMDGVFELGEDGEFEVRIGLKPAPVELAPVLIETERSESPLEEVGFYDRATMGRGTFLIREEIERIAVDRVTDALRRIPSLRVDTSRPFVGPDAMRSPSLVIVSGTRECSPTLYIDGAVMAFGGQRSVRPDDYVSLSEIDAIEVYTRSSEVPVQFDAVNDCGVVAIWTRKR